MSAFQLWFIYCRLEISFFCTVTYITSVGAVILSLSVVTLTVAMATCSDIVRSLGSQITCVMIISQALCWVYSVHSPDCSQSHLETLKTSELMETAPHEEEKETLIRAG